MQTLVEAVFEKFDEVNSEVNTTGGFVIIAPKINIQHGIPQVLVLNARNVDKAGNPDELSKILSKVIELDLSHNVIEDLTEIGLIFQHAPKLQFLNIGFNILSLSKLPTSHSNFPTTDTLKTLILIGTRLSWDAVWFLLRHAKNVSDLHLSLNQFTQVELEGCADQTASVDEEKQQRNKVEKLMFDSNPISSWEEISKLGIAFPELKHMSITDSPVDAIPKEGGEHFKNLKTLWLSNTRISKLEDLENLKYFAALTDLRVNGIPFLGNINEEARRQHYISLLPNIVTLNRGREITDEDRITAERNFIRHYLDHPNPPARYQELKGIHGDVPKLVDINFKPPTKANLVIRFEDKEMCRVDVNLKKTVTELKEFIEPIIGVSASNIDVYYLDPIDFNIEREIMRYPNKQLYTYHMKNNDEILVYRKGTVICGSTVIY